MVVIFDRQAETGFATKVTRKEKHNLAKSWGMTPVILSLLFKQSCMIKNYFYPRSLVRIGAVTLPCPEQSALAKHIHSYFMTRTNYEQASLPMV